MNARQTKQELLREVQSLTVRLQEAEEVIEAIRKGEVDGLLVTTPQGERVFALEGAEFPYRMFVEAMSQGAATLANDGSILYANPAFAQMLRLPQEKIIHKPLLRFIHPADRGTFAAIFKKAVQGEGEGEGEGEVLLIHNLPVQISLQLLPIYDASPVVCAVITDLTRQKKLKRTINSLNRSRAIFNQAADAIIICDEQGIITQASRESQRYGSAILLGKNFDEAITIAFSSLSPQPKHLFTIADVLQGRIWRKQEATISAGENRFYCLCSAQPLRGKTREIIGCVVTLTDITARKQAEEKLQRQAMEIENLYHSAAVGLCMLDGNLRFIRINERLAEINGIPAVEHIGRRIRELMPQLADVIEPSMHRILKTGEPMLNLEIFSETPAQPGIKRHFLEHWLPVKDENGMVTGINVVVEEITERKRMEQMLRESEEKFRSAFANAAIGFAMADPDGRFLDANPAYCRITGYNVEELRAMGWPRMIHPEDYAENMRLVDQMLSGQSNFVELENRYIRKDGTTVWVRKSISLVRNAADAPLWSLALIEDITERKRIEEALRESEARFRQVVESLPQLVWTCAPEGPCDYLSPQWVRYTGKNEAEQLGYGWLAQLNPDDRKRVIAQWHTAATRGENFDTEFRIRRHDGIYRWFRTLAIPLRDEAGRIVKWFGGNTDIDDIKQAENALRQRTAELERLSATLEERVQERTEELRMLNLELQQSQARLKQLSRDLLDAQEKERKRVAWELHDSIGSSLTAIKFRIENVLRESVSNGSQAIATLEKVVPVVQTAVMEAKRIQMNLRPSILDDIGIVATTRWFCNQFRETYPEVQLERHVKINEDDVPDSLKTVIFRIFQEGLNNAARHSKSPLVSFYLWKSNQTLRLLIRDRGEGFDLSEVQSRTGYGRGLGLESMRERADLSGGRFVIATRQGKGTAIRVSWPIDSTG